VYLSYVLNIVRCRLIGPGEKSGQLSFVEFFSLPVTGVHESLT
jgi:hypothetical protein